MKAAEVKGNLSATADIPERQLRPLTLIKNPEEQHEIYRKAVKTAPEGKVTAWHSSTYPLSDVGPSYTIV